MVITSRYLSPAEVGVYSIAVAFTAIAQTFRDFGVAEYLIVSREVTVERIRAAFTLNLTISWTMAAITFLSRDAVAAFYGNPGVADVLSVLSVNLLLVPFGAVTMAYLRREMQMRGIVTASLLGSVATQVVSIVCVIAGASYMGLAWGALAGVVVNVGIARYYRPAWFPRGPGLAGVKEAFRFGANISVVYIFAQIGRNAPDLIIGRVLGEGAVGLFSRAMGMLDVFSGTVVSAVSTVALPHFAETGRSAGSVDDEFNRVAEFLAGIGWLYCAAISIGAHLLVGFLLGEKWLAAAPFVSILAISHSFDISLSMSKEYLISRGAVSQSARLQVVNQALRILACVVSAPFGLHAVCLGLVAASLVNAVLTLGYMRRALGFTVTPFLRALKRSAVATIAGLLVWIAAAAALDHSGVHQAIAAVAYGVIVATVSILSLRAVNHPVYTEITRLAARVLRR